YYRCRPANMLKRRAIRCAHLHSIAILNAGGKLSGRGFLGREKARGNSAFISRVSLVQIQSPLFARNDPARTAGSFHFPREALPIRRSVDSPFGKPIAVPLE